MLLTYRNTSMAHSDTVLARSIAPLKAANMAGVLLHPKKATLASDSTNSGVWPTIRGAGVGSCEGHDDDSDLLVYTDDMISSFLM